MTAIPSNFHEIYSKNIISKRVQELGQQITSDYKGKHLTVLVILKGSIIFAADLIRCIDLPLNVEFMGLRSYGNRTETSGVVQITMDVKHPLEGQDVLIIEDIVDSGLTLDYLRKNLKTRNLSTLALASLLHKPSRAIVDIPIEYLGFEVPDKFVVGYGLDYAGQYRNLPAIGHLDPPPK